MFPFNPRTKQSVDFIRPLIFRELVQNLQHLPSETCLNDDRECGNGKLVNFNRICQILLHVLKSKRTQRTLFHDRKCDRNVVKTVFKRKSTITVTSLRNYYFLLRSNLNRSHLDIKIRKIVTLTCFSRSL